MCYKIKRRAGSSYDAFGRRVEVACKSGRENDDARGAEFGCDEDGGVAPDRT
jgi:hypothetical protein